MPKVAPPLEEFVIALVASIGELWSLQLSASLLWQNRPLCIELFPVD